MKTITLRTINNKGKTDHETNLEISEGKTLIIQKCPASYDKEFRQKLHEYTSEALEKLNNTDSTMITIPVGVEFQVLEIKE
jgi:hypothetical protein